MIALNDEIADGRDVSWIWDVDFEPLLAGLDRSSPRAAARPSSRCGFAYGGLSSAAGSRSSRRSSGALDRGLDADSGRRRARRPPDLHGDARAAADRRRARARAQLLGARRMRIRVGHLYPDYLNIYADRGNIAVLAARARRAGTSSTCRRSGSASRCRRRVDLFYIGGGQDREQALVAADLAAQGGRAAEAVDGRRGVSRRLRRLPAARPLLPRPRGRRASRASGCCRCTRSPASAG